MRPIHSFEAPQWGSRLPGVREPNIRFAPRSYVCRRVRGTLSLNGRLDDPFWEHAPWSDDFVDIEGESKPRPTKRTRFKMLWDDENFYIGVELEEDQIWATYAERDTILCDENNLEIFIDPDGDTHNYFELQFNALNTVWDLMLPKPYRDGGPRINGWNVLGIQSAVHIEGELNNPAADNRRWTLEVAIPWSALIEGARNRRRPEEGDVWRINFSRVKWPLEVRGGRYAKRIDPATGSQLAEYNWVWSPIGTINMHYPELWGYVLFSDGDREFQLPPDEQSKWELRRIYYRQRNFKQNKGKYCADFELLRGDDEWTINPLIEATTDLFQASVPSADGRGTIKIREDGRVWEEYDE